MDYNLEFAAGMTFDEYQSLFESLVKEGRTTQKDQKESYINYTKLNWSRSKRTIKTLNKDSERINLQGVSDLKFLVITEPWCGDSAFGLPVISKFAEDLDIDLRILLRDDNQEIMNLHLTNGGQSIPKLIVLNKEGEVLSDWGPRPNELQSLVKKWKREDKLTNDEFQINVQKWYNADKGASIISELSCILDPVTSC